MWSSKRVAVKRIWKSGIGSGQLICHGRLPLSPSRPRCIPCEACAQLDSRIVERDPVVSKLLDQFVCVRIVQANGLDLSLFQYDYDQSLAAFFLNADGTIYGRYGTRSHETESERDVSVDGFTRALEGALELHRQFPANKPL